MTTVFINAAMVALVYLYTAISYDFGFKNWSPL